MKRSLVGFVLGGTFLLIPTLACFQVTPGG